jgi:glucose/arabinose dehydrogenase
VARVTAALDERAARRPVALRALLALVVIGTLLAGPLASSSSAQLRLEEVDGTYQSPIHVDAPYDDPSRQFVVERDGDIHVVLNGRKLDRRFLRIPGGLSQDGERGLLSMAFAPDYSESRKFYVFYTTPSGDLRVDEFRRHSADPNVASASSQRRVIRVEHSAASNHNGGQLVY